MANKKQKSKARLDKYYKIAKEQGYRSRAAFKLIQLNKKFGFLEKAVILVDLCAAPGGWLQVASKFMASQSLILGLDLDKIKPIPGVKTFQQDITTPHCVELLKKELGDYQADVFLNDGAPNVGCNWSKDSHVQCELALSALKLASQFLRKGGWFVTKVFRSNDFNSLKWVFNKFFGRVEVTKPMASRNTSAQIFVVCSQYLCPEFIDQRLFDPSHVFQDTEAEMLKREGQSGIGSLKALLAKRRNRAGYEDDMPSTMIRQAPLAQFIQCPNPFQFLSYYNKVVVSPEEQHKYFPLAKPPEDLEQSLSDLRVLGGAQITKIVKWRAKVKGKLVQGRSARKADIPQIGSEEELDIKILTAQKDELRDQRKKRERAAKRDIKQKKVTHQIQNDDQEMAQLAKAMREQDPQQIQYIDDSDEEEVDNTKKKPKRDPVTNLNNQELENALDKLHTRKKEKQATDQARRLKKKVASEPKQTGGPKFQAERLLPTLQGLKRSRAYLSNDAIQGVDQQDALLSFQNPLKKKRKIEQEPKQKEDEDQFSDQEDKYLLDLPATEMQKRKKRMARQAKRKEREQEQAREQAIEIVPQRSMDDYTLQSLAQTMAIAKKMLRKRQRDDIIIGSYLNPMPQDQNLPDWFKDDEERHCYKRLPITKEQYQAQKQRLQNINAKASKKVLQAEFRKKRKVALKMKKANQKATGVLAQEGVTQSWKLREAHRVFKRAMSQKKKQKKYIVGQKGKTLNKGSKFTKFVDARLKKDKRGVERLKRIKKRRHVSRRKGR